MEVIYIGEVTPTPLGPIWVAISERGLVAVEIGASQASFVKMLQHRFPGCQPALDLNRASEAVQQIQDYLEGNRREFTLPLDWSGMKSFQQQALRLTLAVPYGRVTTYGKIASQMGSPRAARAVGRAEATNPMPLVIPCHRVLGTDGGLHGYGAPGGVKTKAWLLELESR